MKYSIVNVKNLNNEYRMDAEYFSPAALYNDRLIQQGKYKTITELGIKVVSGPFGSSLHSSLYLSKGVPFIRISDLCDFYIDEQNLVYISEYDNNRLKSSQLNIGDLVLSKVGNTIGVVSKISKNIGHSNISENNIGLKFSSTISEDTKNYILTLLNCKNGQIQIFRKISGNGQPKLNVSDIEELFIPIFDVSFEKLISNLVQLSYQYREKCVQYYKKANSCLKNELSLDSKYLSYKLWSVKNYFDVKDVNRLDAEYFQPKYDEIIEKIKTYTHGWDKIGSQFDQNKKNFVIDINSKYKYVEIGSINITNGAISPENILGKNLPANAKIDLQQNDILISKVRTYRGAVAIVETTNYVGSGAFTVLHEKINSKINKETLYTYFKLKPILDLTLKYNTGSSYPTITDEDILNMPIPIFQQEIQNSVKNNIQQAQKIQSQSKQLLEIAKRGVEIAIEQDEDIATSWINQELQKIGVEL